MPLNQAQGTRIRTKAGGDGIEIEFFQMTDVGCVRAENEDAVGSRLFEDGYLFALADGLGGHEAGEVASSLALEVLMREMAAARGAGSMMKGLRRAFQRANLEIYQKAITVPELRRMGTTLTASVVTGGTLVAAHIGDSRLYVLRDGVLSQITKDHTSVWEQVEYGILTSEEARTHPNRHTLTRYLGHDLIAGIDALTMALRAGDVLVQCSDGIHDVLPEPEMMEQLQQHRPEAACREIIRRCLDAGGPDNMSVQVAAVVSCSDPPARSSRWRFWR